MNRYKINPRTGKFDMVGEAGEGGGGGAGYILPVASQETLGGVKMLPVDGYDLAIENGYLFLRGNTLTAVKEISEIGNPYDNIDLYDEMDPYRHPNMENLDIFLKGGAADENYHFGSLSNPYYSTRAGGKIRNISIFVLQDGAGPYSNAYNKNATVWLEGFLLENTHLYVGCNLELGYLESRSPEYSEFINGSITVEGNLKIMELGATAVFSRINLSGTLSLPSDREAGAYIRENIFRAKQSDPAEISDSLRENNLFFIGNQGSGNESYTLPVATATKLGGVKVADSSDIQIDLAGFIKTRYGRVTIYMDVETGDNNNDGSNQRPVKSLSKAISMIHAKGEIVILNNIPEINIPVDMLVVRDKDITISVPANQNVQTVNIFCPDGAQYAHYHFTNSKLTLYSWSQNTGHWPAPLVHFNLHDLRLRNSDCHVIGNLTANGFALENGTMKVTDRFWIDAENSVSIMILNWLVNCLITCAEFASINADGKQSYIRSKGATMMTGNEIQYLNT